MNKSKKNSTFQYLKRLTTLRCFDNMKVLKRWCFIYKLYVEKKSTFFSILLLDFLERETPYTYQLIKSRTYCLATFR